MMKLGSGTGSLINHLQSRSMGAYPVEGLGVTFLHWSDRSPGTIVKVWKDKDDTVWFSAREDEYKRTDKNGMSEVQEYEYTPNPKGRLVTFKWSDKGWQSMYLNPTTNRWKKDNQSVYVGKREKYHDFTF